MPLSLKAFYYFPQYNSPKETEFSTSPNTEISAEYAPDLMAYDFELSQIQKLRTKNKYFSTTVGSLDGSYFHLGRSIKASEFIHPKHQVNLLSVEQTNFHQNSDYQVLGWKHWIKPNFAFGFFGEFFHTKANDDIGISIDLINSDASLQGELKFYWENYSYNKRTKTENRYKNSFFPQRLSLSLTKDTSSSYQYFDLNFLSKSQWQNTTQQKEYGYRSGQLQWMYFSKSERKIQLAINADSNETSISNLSGNEDSYLEKSTLRIRASAASLKKTSSSLRYGIDFFLQEYKNRNSSTQLLYTSPFIRWQKPHSNFSHRLVVTGFNAFGERSLLALKNTYETQVRWDASYKIPLREGFDWTWGFSIDLDRFGSDDTWEGGYSKMIWVF